MENEEFSPWIDHVLGCHGPFYGDSAELNRYVKALAKAIRAAKEEVLLRTETDKAAYTKEVKE